MVCQIPLRSGWPSKVRPFETAGGAADRLLAKMKIVNAAEYNVVVIIRLILPHAFELGRLVRGCDVAGFDQPLPVYTNEFIHFPASGSDARGCLGAGRGEYGHPVCL